MVDQIAEGTYHSSLRDEIDTLCDSYNKLKNYCESIGDAIRDTVDTPFYERMDDFAQSMEKLSINNYTTENTLDVTTTTHYEGVDFSIRKQSISIQDIFTSSPAMDKMLKEDYNSFMELPDAPDLSYGDYKQALTYTRSFDYKSIEDSQLSKEFWTNLGIGAVIVIASFACPPAGIALGIAYGTLELGSAAAGRDWLTQRELGKGERVMRGTFALLDIIPGVRAFGASMHTARVATGTLGQADNVLQVMGKYTLQRTKNFAGQMGRASRRTGAFGKLLISNTDEAGQLFLAKSKGIGNRALSAGKSSIDDLSRKYKNLAAKGKKVLSGNFDDIKRYIKSLMPGEHVLVATPDGSVFRVAKSNLGESSLELVARDKTVYAMNGIKGGTEGISGAKKYKVKKGPIVKSAKINTKGTRGADAIPPGGFRDMMSPEEVARYDKHWGGVANKISDEAIDNEILRMNRGEIRKPTGGKYQSAKVSGAVDMNTGDISIGYSRKTKGNPSAPDFANGETLHPELQQRIENTQRIASNDANNPYKADSSYKKWSVDNCAEVFAADNSLKNGAEMDNIFLNTKFRNTGEYAAPCKNCEITFSDFLMPNGGK